MINLKPGVSEAILSFLSERGKAGAVRIALHSTGCCDASLGMMLDKAKEGDIRLEMEGITFLIDRELSGLAGDITISRVDETGRKGFLLTSSQPLGEWDGFGVTEIRIKEDQVFGRAK